MPPPQCFEHRQHTVRINSHLKLLIDCILWIKVQKLADEKKVAIVWKFEVK